MVVVETIEDAHKLLTGLNQDDVKTLNLGGTKPNSDNKAYTSTISLSEHDETLLNDLKEQGFEIEMQQVPSEKITKY
ncbi:hypothetical protein ERUR111494_07105 [Erysipelothrix urinaevulpis]|nr:PTS sugar transporter subunit IIB [Erysipelothrix urinaevulpis]